MRNVAPVKDPRPDGSDRRPLEARYLQLVRHELPTAAANGRWVLRADHCFGRILLDTVVGGCWYDVLDRRRVAFRQLDDAQLARAVTLSEQLLTEGDPLVRRLNEDSLAWRSARARAARKSTSAEALRLNETPVRSAGP